MTDGSEKIVWRAIKLYDHKTAKVSERKSSGYLPGYVAVVTIYVKSIPLSLSVKINFFRMNMKNHPVNVEVTIEKDMNLL